MQTLEALNTNYRKLFDKDATKDEGRIARSGKGFENWGWFITLDNLSNSRPETWEEFEKMGVIQFLNICSFYKDKQKEQERQIKLQQMRSGR